MLSLAETIMEKAYWLARKRASLVSAQAAACSRSRLVHYDLAGRYGLKANALESRAVALVDSLPPPIYAKRASALSNDSDDA